MEMNTFYSSILHIGIPQTQVPEILDLSEQDSQCLWVSKYFKGMDCSGVLDLQPHFPTFLNIMSSVYLHRSTHRLKEKASDYQGEPRYWQHQTQIFRFLK